MTYKVAWGIPLLLCFLFIFVWSRKGPEKPSAVMVERCLSYGGRFQLPLRETTTPKQQAFNLTGASWFDVRHMFAKVVIRLSTSESQVVLLVVEGHLNNTQLKGISLDGSIVHNFWSFVTGANEDKQSLFITTAYGPHTLILSSYSNVTIECKRETDWSIVAMVAGGFFLSTMSGILGAYHATLLICGAILGMLIGIAIPLIVLFNKQTKIFITAASAGLMSYGAIFCWHYLVSSAYFWMYLCMSSIFGMWWFGAGGAEGGKQVVSWSLWLLGMVLLGTSTRHFGTINVALLVIAFGCRVAVELGLPQRMLGDVMQHLYWHIWLKFFPKYKRMLTNEEYEAQSQHATEEALKQMRLYYFKYDNWRSHFQDQPETIKRIETFLGNKDHLQIELLRDKWD